MWECSDLDGEEIATLRFRLAASFQNDGTVWRNLEFSKLHCNPDDALSNTQTAIFEQTAVRHVATFKGAEHHLLGDQLSIEYINASLITHVMSPRR
jgi:hypothetical protein